MATSLTGRRREIAALLTERDMTLYELAKAMGTPTGSIYRLVHRMVADGVLEPDTDPPTRGTMFSLNSLYREELDGDVGGASPVGQLAAGQRVLVVQDIDRPGLYSVFDRTSSAASIGWVAEVGGSILLALLPGAGMLQADRLAVALHKAGGRVQVGVVGEVLPGEAVRHAAAMIEALTEPVS